jgi:hypothetical protein
MRVTLFLKYFSDVPALEKYSYFLPVSANSTPLVHVVRLYFVYIFLAYYWSRQQALASHWLEQAANSMLPFLVILPILHCLVLVRLRHQENAQKNLLYG